MTFIVPGYRVDRLLGAGSQGDVWLGEQLASGERVALKRIPAESLAVVAAARAEAALLAALDHPSLIALRAFVPTDSAMVLVLELAEAGTLAGLLRRRGRLTAPEVVATISPVAAALAHAHAAGVLHGDVSAANILFSAAGYPKLADLGLARMLAAAGDPPLGTPAYLDPTIAAGGPAGLASDVFSLAAVALHALTGAGPWCAPDVPEPTADQVLAAAATGEIVELDRRLRSMPPELAEVLARALAVEPHRRGSAAELALDLRAALPPAPVTLAGGRIVEPVGRHSVERLAGSAGAVRPVAGSTCTGRVQPGDPAIGLSFVPIDLTRVAPIRPPADVAAALRSGALADLGGSEQPARLRSLLSRRSAAGTARDRGRWLRVPVAGLRRTGRLGRPARKPPFAAMRQSHAGRRQPADSLPQRAGIAVPALRFWTPATRCTVPAGPLRVPTIRLGRPLRILALLLMSGLVGAVLVSGWPPPHRRSAAAETGMPVGRTQAIANAAGSGGTRTGTQTPTDTRIRSGTVGAGTGTGVGGAGGTPPAGHGVGTPAMSSDRLAAVLAALDAVREQAFATRRPELLSRIYASPALLAADTAQLTGAVPAGCRLLGVRTGYRDPEPVVPVGSAPARSVALTVTASLSPATLSCAGVVRSRTRPAGPTRLRLLLVDSDVGWRIASQRLG